MADVFPLTLWRRFLSAPADSRGKTLTMAFLVSAICALGVSTAAVLLGPRIDANRAAEARAQLDALVATLPGLADLLAESGADRLDEIIVDLNAATVAEGVAAEDFDPEAVSRDPALNTTLSADADIAGIGTRPNLARLYIVRSGTRAALVILPFHGAGYQGPISGYLALEGDLNTVAGLTITEQAETPGLGAKITEPAWQALWPGTRLADETGEVRFAVKQGGATTEYQVDGITGATRTGNGMTNIIRFWVGPDGFGPVLEKLKSGEI